MNKGFLVAVFLAMVGLPANATCYDYEEHGELGDEYIICYEDKCDLSRMTAQCAGAGPNFTEYDTGWRFGYEAAPRQEYTYDEYTSWEGNLLSPEDAAKVRVFKVDKRMAWETWD